MYLDFALRLERVPKLESSQGAYLPFCGKGYPSNCFTTPEWAARKSRAGLGRGVQHAHNFSVDMHIDNFRALPPPPPPPPPPCTE